MELNENDFFLHTWCLILMLKLYSFLKYMTESKEEPWILSAVLKTCRLIKKSLNLILKYLYFIKMILFYMSCTKNKPFAVLLLYCCKKQGHSEWIVKGAKNALKRLLGFRDVQLKVFYIFKDCSRTHWQLFVAWHFVFLSFIYFSSTELFCPIKSGVYLFN